MGVHGTFCQLCGLPTGHDHYVSTATEMLKIYRGASENGGHIWEAGEHPFNFGPDHAWLKDAVVLPLGEERVMRGAIEDGAMDGVFVFEGAEDGLAYHHACWVMQGSPEGSAQAIRSLGTHGWSIVEPYHEQLFDFHALLADDKGWMLSDPTSFARSRARIEAMLGVAKMPFSKTTTLSERITLDRDWVSLTTRENDRRTGFVRARVDSIERAEKTGFSTLVQVSKSYPGDALPDAKTLEEIEAFELELKQTVESAADAVLVVASIGGGEATFLIWAKNGEATKAAVTPIPGSGTATIVLSDDPDWQAATRVISAFGR